MANMILKVTGMKCGGCENQIQATVMACSGIEKVTASHQNASVELEYDPAITDLEVVRKAIISKGFTLEN